MLLKVKCALCFISVTLFLFSCGKKDNSASYIQSIASGDFVITVEYKSPESFITDRISKMKEMNLDSNLLKLKTEELKKQSENQMLFFMTVSPKQDSATSANNASLAQQVDFATYSNNLRTLLFGLQDKVYLRDKKGNKIYPSVYNYEKNFELSKKQNFVFAFPKMNNDGKTFLIGNRVYFVIDRIESICNQEQLLFRIRNS